MSLLDDRIADGTLTADDVVTILREAASYLSEKSRELTAANQRAEALQAKVAELELGRDQTWRGYVEDTRALQAAPLRRSSRAHCAPGYGVAQAVGGDGSETGGPPDARL